MEGKKKSFTMFVDSLDVIDELDDHEIAELFKAIRAYHRGEEYSIESRFVRVAITPFLNQFERDKEYKEAISAARREAGRKHKGNQYTKTEPEEVQPEQTEQNGTNGTSYTYTNTSSQVIEEVNEEETPQKSSSPRFIPPSLDEMLQYAAEKYPEAPPNVVRECFDYYESNGWKVGKNSMKKWHNALSRWISTSKPNYRSATDSNPYQRQVAASQQLGQALASRYAAEIERESSGESQFVPRPLSRSE